MKQSLIRFALLFITELAIAQFQFSSFIRGFVGDVLIIPLLFYFLKVFVRWKTLSLATFTLGIAVSIECIQLCDIVKQLPFQNKILTVMLGTTFDVLDFFAYGVGYVGVLAIEKRNNL